MVAILTRNLTGSLESVLRSFSRAEAINRAVGVVFEMLVAKVFVVLLSTLPESIIEFAVVFPT